MSDKYFLDTNVFVYSFDPDAPQKQIIAKRLIQSALADGNGLISYQVVQEFLNVATRKFVKPLSLTDCQEYLQTVLNPLCSVFVTIELYQMALKMRDRYNYSFYDSLIIAAAIDAGCSRLYSEDLQHNQQISGLTILNPFLPNESL